MKIFPIGIPKSYLELIEDLIEQHGYSSPGEFIRHELRDYLLSERFLDQFCPKKDIKAA